MPDSFQLDQLAEIAKGSALSVSPQPAPQGEAVNVTDTEAGRILREASDEAAKAARVAHNQRMGFIKPTVVRLEELEKEMHRLGTAVKLIRERLEKGE